MGRNVLTGALENTIATRDVNTGQLINVGGTGGTQTTDNFTGNGSQTSFPLSFTPQSAKALLVFVIGAVASNYNLVGNSIVFTAAPANGASIAAYYEY